jgi:glucuronate isomerase
MKLLEGCITILQKYNLFFDYHCHFKKDIAEDRQFENLAQIWIDGDHYK